MNFLPNLPEDGGTLVVPMFHKYVRKYCEDYKHLRKVPKQLQPYFFSFLFFYLTANLKYIASNLPLFCYS